MDNIMQPFALAGVRIIDLSWAIAGPFCTQVLAYCGAEVIKVESMKRLDLARAVAHIYARTASDKLDVERSQEFNAVNQNKLDIRLDLSRPESVAIVKRLAHVSDALVENFSAGVLNRLGLGYPVLREQNPSIVLASLSGCGARGPEARFLGYAPIFGAASGASHFIGYQDGPPTAIRAPGDLVNGSITAFAILAALTHRQQTGRGQFIDLSSREGMSVLIGDAVMEYTMNGRDRGREGNRDPSMAPHNCYPCSGDDRWVAIAVETDAEWRALCEAMGNPAWAQDERFSDALSRWKDQDEMDRRIAEWTRARTPQEVTRLLQAKGVAAFPSMSAKDLYEDPHLAERGVFQEIEHPRLGKVSVLAPPWKFSKTPARITRPGPLLGEHIGYVLGDVLGIPPGEIERLVEEKVVY